MVVVSGIALEIHYCMGKEAGVQWYGASDDKCGRCGMKNKNSSCCHDEHKFVKLTDSHKVTSNDFSAAADAPVFIPGYPLYDEPLITALTDQQPRDNSPPAAGGHFTCILNCVFRL